MCYVGPKDGFRRIRSYAAITAFRRMNEIEGGSIVNKLFSRLLENRDERMAFRRAFLVIPALFLFVSSSFILPTLEDPPHEATASPMPTPTSLVKPENGSAYSDEVLLLRTQIEVMRSYDQKLLDTVYWCLGVAVALFVLMAGFNWVTYSRSYERDKESLRAELQAVIQKGISDLQRQSRKATDSITEGLDESIDDRINSHVAKFEGNLKALT